MHFTFELSNYNKIVAGFSAVNESTWEHLKLVFFPMLFTTIIGYFYIGKNIPNYLCAKVTGIIYAISFITIFFYTYTGILGTHYSVLDIGSFFVAVFIGEYISLKKMLSFNNTCNKLIPIICMIILFLCFVIFTYIPPKINYFKDPITGTFWHIQYEYAKKYIY